jgi:multidrug efflux pump subunit AcrA (membrane-fusion protein)
MQTKKSGKKKIIIAGITCVAIIGLISFLVMRPSGENYSEETAKIQDIQTYYSFSGNIEAKDSQIVVSGGMLPIKKFYVKEGDLVKEGDILFLLDESDIAANIDQAAAGVEISKINYEKMRTTTKDQQLAQISNTLSSAQLTYNEAKTNLERMSELFNSGGISRQEYEQVQKGYDAAKLQLESAQSNYDITAKAVDQNVRTAKAQLDQSEANYEAAKKQAGDVEILAELDGEISEIFVEENEALITGTKIMNIVDYDNLEIKIKVDEYDLGAVTEGKEVIVTINQLGKDVTGRVSEVSKEAETVNEVSFFTASVDLEKNEDLRVGLSVEVKAFNKSAAGATTISMKALQFDDENQPFIYYRDSSGNVVTKSIKTGINDGTLVQILEGIKTGEVILIPAEATAEGFTRPKDMVTEE